MQVYSTVGKDAQMNRTAQIVLSRFFKIPSLYLFTNSCWLCSVFIRKKRFLRKECKEHSIVCISTLMIINKILLIVHWCYWLFGHGLKFYWICCSLEWMPDHAKEYSFDVIEFTMRANESCFDEIEFRKTLMKVLKLNWMFTIMQISLWRVHSRNWMSIGANERLFALLSGF